jgi:NADP-dependent 3-hydroxy acid dehydrogenase YdfG
VNSAGVGPWEPLGLADGKVELWQDEIEINLVALMAATQAAARKMIPQGSGHIVNVSSMAGRFPAVGATGYVTSKWGVTGFTQGARIELRKHGIRVTLIEPGEVATPMQPEDDLATKRMLSAEDVADAIVYAVTRPEHVLVNDIQIVPMPER